MSSTSAPLAKRDEVRHLLDRMKPQLQAALPRHITADRMVRVAMTAIQTTPKLMACTSQSLLACVVECAALGLEPGPLGHAYLVPYKETCTLIIGYRGLIDLARRSGQIVTLQAHVVYEHDDFDFSYSFGKGMSPFIRHTPKLGDRGKRVAVYAAAQLVGSEASFQFEVLSPEDVQKAKDSSASARSSSSPWATHTDEMWRKTAVRKLAKYLPVSVEFCHVLELDHAADTGGPQPFEAVQLGAGDQTIASAATQHRQKALAQDLNHAKEAQQEPATNETQGPAMS